MKLLLDTNILLDIILKREPFFESAKKVLELAKYQEFELYVSASSITDIYYIASRSLKDKIKAKNLVVKILQTLNIASIGSNEVNYALNLEWKDFEDAMQYSVAFHTDVDCIITRNKSDFTESGILIYTPDEFLNIIYNI